MLDSSAPYLAVIESDLQHDEKLMPQISFTLACSIGAIANVGIASSLFQMKTKWIIAALAGIIVGAV